MIIRTSPKSVEEDRMFEFGEVEKIAQKYSDKFNKNIFISEHMDIPYYVALMEDAIENDFPIDFKNVEIQEKIMGLYGRSEEGRRAQKLLLENDAKEDFLYNLFKSPEFEKAISDSAEARIEAEKHEKGRDEFNKAMSPKVFERQVHTDIDGVTRINTVLVPLCEINE